MNFETGLTSKQVAERKKKGLINGEPEIKTKSIRVIINSHVFTLFNFINVMLAVSLILVASYRNMTFLGVVFWNAIIGIYQEIRSKRIIDRLSLISMPKVNVFRECKEEIIEQKDIVLDDIMILKSGNQICADGLVIEGECSVNESLLTGESDLIYKKKGDEVLSGSFVVSGMVKAQVIHIGRDNYASKIINEVKYIKRPNSEILRSIKLIIKYMSICLVPVASIIFVKQYFFLNRQIGEAVVGTTASVVGMIPNGLVLLTSIVMAVASIRLAAYNTLVQEMYCIESLARVDVICLDKTGTITDGVMALDHVEIVDRSFAYDEAMNAFVYHNKDSNETFQAIKAKYNKYSSWKPILTVPFSSENKWSLIAFEGKGSYILGAAESICLKAADAYKRQINAYASEGKRVLAFCHSDIVSEDKKLPDQIKIIAFLIIGDQVRADAKETLQYFNEQGVGIYVISGDHPATVQKIAENAGIEGADQYIDASVLKTNEDIADSIDKYRIFGRVTPLQKLEIIKALKEKGHTVAMTGDGVNDVLALKEADCSIAMQTGSDAARTVSQLVLLDSKFSSMPKILAEGRRSINNIERSAALYVSKTIYVCLLAVLFMLIQIPYPFAPIQFTLIGTLSIGIPSFILALEPNLYAVKGNFMTNIMKKAIPGGIIVFLSVLSSILFAVYLKASTEQTFTMATISTSISAMIILIRLCKPMTFIRMVMCIILGSAFVVALVLFRDLFYVVRLSLSMLIAIMITNVFCYFIHKELSKYVEKRLET